MQTLWFGFRTLGEDAGGHGLQLLSTQFCYGAIHNGVTSSSK